MVEVVGEDLLIAVSYLIVVMKRAIVCNTQGILSFADPPLRPEICKILCVIWFSSAYNPSLSAIEVIHSFAFPIQQTGFPPTSYADTPHTHRQRT